MKSKIYTKWYSDLPERLVVDRWYYHWATLSCSDRSDALVTWKYYFCYRKSRNFLFFDSKNKFSYDKSIKSVRACEDIFAFDVRRFQTFLHRMQKYLRMLWQIWYNRSNFRRSTSSFLRVVPLDLLCPCLDDTNWWNF